MSVKINPRRKPATQADVDRAKTTARNEAIRYVWAIFFTTMRDKFGWSNEKLHRLWEEVGKLSDSVSGGYVTVPDLLKALKDEAGIELK